MESQKIKILNMLLDNSWVCSSNFYAAYIADPRRRICDLKKDGYILENRKCQQHDYHKGYSKEWKLVFKPKEEIWDESIISEEILTDMFGAGGKEEVKEVYMPSLF